MGRKARREYAAQMRRRYVLAGRADRGRLLTEFRAVTGYHRKYAIAVLGGVAPGGRAPRVARGTRFGPEVTKALLGIWRAADYPWSCRLVAVLPLWMPWAQKRLGLASAVCAILESMSARSIDRVLKPHRSALRRRMYGRTKPGTLLKHQIPIRCERWDTTQPGWCETDTVSHCGGSGEGEFGFSVNLTDVASTWTETRVVLGKGKRFVVAALDEMRQILPFPLRGLDSDNGSEFINTHCVDWCTEHTLQFTRSRPYHKNDNAHIEQKNWTHVRKVFGWKRIDSPIAIEIMNELYRNELRLFMNYFQPSVKLVERVRVGSRVRRKFDKPKTPFERLIELGALSEEQITLMTAERASLDPFELSGAIEAKVRAVLSIPSAPLTARTVRNGPPLAGVLSRKGANAQAQREAAPVRSYVARQ